MRTVPAVLLALCSLAPITAGSQESPATTAATHSNVATGRAKVSAAARAGLQDQVRNSEAVSMNPEAIAATHVFVSPESEPSTQAQPVPADAMAGALPESTVAAAPAGPGVESAVAPELSASAPVTVQPSLLRGRLYFVKLPAVQEAAAHTLVAEQVAAIAPAEVASVQTFTGVVRQITDNNVEVQLKPYVLIGQILKYMSATKTFTGSVAVGVADLLDAEGNASLSAPLKFQAIDSKELKTLDHLSPPYEYFDVSTDSLGKSVTLRIASNFSHDGVSVTVPVEPTLIVEVDTNNIRALGLQPARITVRAVGDTPPLGFSASLSAPNAFLDNNAPIFDGRGVAYAELRGDNPGEITVSASATGYVAGQYSPIHVFWPWQTLLLTMLGGLVGGFIRLGPHIRSGMNGSRFVIALSIAMLIGLVVFVLYPLGVNLLPVKFTVQVGDLFAFGAAALGGWMGSGVLPQLTPAKP